MTEKTDMVAMPFELTAENGAKYVLIGEFSESYTAMCGDCEGDGHFHSIDEECELCEGTGEITQKVDVSWATIKEIYAMVVKKVGEGKITLG